MCRSEVRGSVRRAYIVLKRLRQLAVAGLLLGCTSAAPTSRASAQPSDFETQANVAYGPLPGELGDLYIPSEPRGRKGAVVVIHGGGWVEGARQSDDELAKMIARFGLVAFNIDYRLADKNRPETRWPVQLVDAQLAVRFLRAHAAEYSIDPARIGAMGDSAGAQLAVFLGVLPRIVDGDQAGLYPRQRPDVRAVVDQFGPMDIAGMGSYGTGSIEALFGTPMPDGNALLTSSPIPSVTAHSAPMYILHGQADVVVPFDQSRVLADTLRAHGVRAELVPFNGGHAYANVAPEEIGRLEVTAVKWLVEKLKR